MNGLNRDGHLPLEVVTTLFDTIFFLFKSPPSEMPSIPRPNILTYANFDRQALCRQASTLRQGVSCACNPDQRPVSGTFNWAIFILFEDGVRWIFRSSHPRDFLPMEMGMKLLASEAASLRFLKAHSDVPVPEVYGRLLKDADRLYINR